MKRLFLSTLLALTGVLLAGAHGDYTWFPKVAPVAVLTNNEGEEEELDVQKVYDAPLTLTLRANPTDTTGFVVYYEWDIWKIENEVETMLAVRNDEVTTFTFEEGGKDIAYRVGLAISYVNRETGDEGEVEQDREEMLTFQLRGSSLHVFNAFSPNGDGVNDVYRVKTQSMRKFRMKIFNRWGHQVAAGNEHTLPVEYEEEYAYYVCWDGTYNGRKVDDGVYFIIVEAVGADGIVYKRRSDINVLTRSSKENSNE